MSQERLAIAAGVDPRTISDIEQSRTRYPRAETAYGIAEALGLTGEERDRWLSLATPPAGLATAAEPGSGLAIPGGFAATVLADAVRELRQRRGLSPSELARRVGMAARSINDIEAGRRGRVHPDNAVSLANELGLDGTARERFLRLASGEAAGEPTAGEDAALEATGLEATGLEATSAASLAATEPTESEPAEPAELFGRERELAEIADLLPKQPLVVVTGPGGVGKTALAHAVLARLDRPHLALDLTSVPAGEKLDRAIALVARFDEGTDAAWVQQLGALLPSGGVLLLDNLEHLQGVPDAVEAILASRDDLTVLATSRAIGGLGAGAEYAVGPLRVQAAGQVFRDVARRSGRPVPARTPAALIEQVCERLDLLPLTISLAAAWSRLMAPGEILDRLDRPAQLLRTARLPGREPAGEQSRHAAVASTVGWSLALVSEPARALFRALAAYPAPWPLDLVEAVCPVDQLDPLQELVEAGLVSAADNDAGGTSYSMLQTVRDVGSSELLDAPQWREEVLRRHAVHVLGRARELGPALFATGDPALLTQCDQLAPHGQGAVDYLISVADPRAVSFIATWWQYWIHRGLYRRGLTIAARALDTWPAPAGEPAGELPPARDLPTGLYGAAALAYYAGEHQQASGYAARSLAGYEELRDEHGIGTIISLIGMMAFYTGRYEEARDWYRRGLAEISSESEPQTYATLLTNAAPVYAVLGDIPAARKAAEDAARRNRALKNVTGVVANLANLAEFWARTGDRDRARELLSECRELLTSMTADTQTVVQVVLSFGKLAADEGDAATAQEHLDEVRGLMQGTEDPWGEVFADALAAQIAVLNGEMPRARNLARRALRRAEELIYEQAIVAAALAEASAAAWPNDPRDRQAVLDAARSGLRHAQQADEAAVVSLALLVAAVLLDGTSPALVGDDVLTLERLIRQWAARPGCAPYPIAAGSARRRGLTIPQRAAAAPGTPPGPDTRLPPIGDLRELALALCGPDPADRA
jgi:predicted ATPase/DNA-binding XRE family transcriptional regulator